MGMPVSMMQAGASAVLASEHALYDAHAAFFGEALHGAMLDSGNPLAVGDALLAARRATQLAYGNPVHWATTVLWGNPSARLPVNG